MNLVYDYKEELDQLEEQLSHMDCLKKPSRFGESLTNQYMGLYWIKVKFKNDMLEKLNPEYEGVIGFHIMPYSITFSDIYDVDGNCMIVKTDKNKHPFNQQKDNFTDYDPNSGNVHKKPDKNFQIVLITDRISPQGPGWNEKGAPETETTDNGDIQPVNFIEHMKTEWYFPDCINDKHPAKLSTVQEVMDYLKDVVFKTVFKNQ